MNDPTIRAARAGDAPGLRRCMARAYAPFAARLPGLPDVTAGLEGDIRDHLVWVADADGQIIGGLVLVLDAPQAKLANVAVDPDHGGRGLGRALIARAEEAARAAGCTALRLTTHAGMPGNLVLYGRLGWAETGREGARIFMGKRL